METRKGPRASEAIPPNTPSYFFTDPKKRNRIKKFRGRGKAYIDHAIAFARRFPLDEKRPIQEFDVWAQERGIYTIPATSGAEDIDKHSDAWEAMRSRRDRLMNGLNAAAESPDMEELDVRAFYIERSYNSFTRVLPTTHALHSRIGLEKVASVATHHRKKLQIALLSMPVEKQPLIWKHFAKMLYTRYEDVETEMLRQLSLANRDFIELQAELREWVEAGLVSLHEPFVQALLGGRAASRALPAGTSNGQQHVPKQPCARNDDTAPYDAAGDEEEPYC